MAKSKPYRKCEYCDTHPSIWKGWKGTTELLCIECTNPSCKYKPRTGYYSPSYARAIWNRKMDAAVRLKERGVYAED